VPPLASFSITDAGGAPISVIPGGSNAFASGTVLLQEIQDLGHDVCVEFEAGSDERPPREPEPVHGQDEISPPSRAIVGALG
jgi:hypothetical protein